MRRSLCSSSAVSNSPLVSVEYGVIGTADEDVVALSAMLVVPALWLAVDAAGGEVNEVALAAPNPPSVRVGADAVAVIDVGEAAGLLGGRLVMIKGFAVFALTGGAPDCWESCVSDHAPSAMYLPALWCCENDHRYGDLPCGYSLR